MQCRFIGDSAHLAAQGVDLLDQLPLGQSADSRIARHERYRIQINIKKQGPAAHARCRQGCFASGMTAAYNDDIVIFTQFFSPKNNIALEQGK